ncbi:hypothetical protein ACP3T3_07080 [Chryseobacterium sp. CBSDS_008]|uniref:hypothetical protein n=1 Tax=Chryseobacterium sp. CBSDS_008 TaxID=3415265 RepID=UPI003CFA3425
MKKNILVLTAFLSSMMYSQVGINTQNPQGIFNIDGGGDNPVTGVPTPIQQSNDLMMSAAGNVGLGTVTPQSRLHVAGEITVDVTKNSSIHPVTVDLSRIRASAGTTWHLPMGWQADGSLAVLPGQLETAVKVVALGNGTVLTIPSFLWGTGATDTEFYGLKIEGFYFDHCNNFQTIGVIKIYITHGGMNVLLNGRTQGTLTNPSPGVFTWRAPASGCNGVKTFSYNSATRVLSYGSTAGATTLRATATLYGNTAP